MDLGIDKVIKNEAVYLRITDFTNEYTYYLPVKNFIIIR